MTAANCKNCGHALQGNFCSHCGQAADVHVPSTHELAHEVLEGLTHSDSRLWRTLLTLWVRPGKLSSEFIAGRRVAYLPPFRLYLILSVVFFLVASFTHPEAKIVNLNGEEIAELKNDSGLSMTQSDCADLSLLKDHPAWRARLQHACSATVADKGSSLMHGALAAMPKAMFVFLPLVAALNMLLYWRPRHRYAEHLIFFLHVQSFFFTVLTVIALIGIATDKSTALAKAGDVAGDVLLWMLPIYTLLAMRQVFQRGWIGTLLRGAALYIIYQFTFALTISSVFIWALLLQ
jgi:hypothetical protein